MHGGVPEAWIAYGNLLKDLCKFDEALVAYRTAIRLAPDEPLAHFWVGFVSRKIGRDQDAAAAFRKSLDCDPNFAAARNDLRELEAAAGQPATS